MPVINNRFRVIREVSPTLYGCAFVCEDMQGSIGRASRASIASIVIKQVSFERMTNFMLSHPSTGHSPDNPVIEKEVGDIVRSAGGHPNLVQYKDSFVEQQSLYLVMEHCTDGDMHEHLSRCRHHKMACVNALGVLSQVAAALAFLHEHGIAHRDVSLENIMLERGCCKLGDFGLATRRTLCTGGRLVGKKFYMAPEIVAGGVYDPKVTDVWSLGIVFFIMITGSPLVPLASMSVKSFRAFKQAGVVSFLHSWGVAESLPICVLGLLSGMLEINPQKRLTIIQVLEHEALAGRC